VNQVRADVDLPRIAGGMILVAHRLRDSLGRRRNQYKCQCRTCDRFTWRSKHDVDFAEQHDTALRCRWCRRENREVGRTKPLQCELCGGLPHRVRGESCESCGTVYADEPPLAKPTGWERNGPGEVWWE